MRWVLFVGALLLSCIFAVFLLQRTQSDVPQITQQPDQKPKVSVPGENKNENIPAYVFKTLEYVLANGHAPENYVGGRTFQNREQRLKKTDKKGQKITYREWDVHPKVKGKSRGAERLITGSDQSAYYTKDHYKSFIEIK